MSNAQNYHKEKFIAKRRSQGEEIFYKNKLTLKFFLKMQSVKIAPITIFILFLFVNDCWPKEQYGKQEEPSVQTAQENIIMPDAPNIKDTLNQEDLSMRLFLDIDSSGRISIANTRIPIDVWERLLANSIPEYGKMYQIVFRADVATPFSKVWNFVSCAKRHGIFRLSFAAREMKVVNFLLEEQSGTGSLFNELKVKGREWIFNGKAVEKRIIPQPTPSFDYEGVRVVYFLPVIVYVTDETTYGELFAAFDALGASGYKTIIMGNTGSRNLTVGETETDEINQMASDNFSAACINVIRQADMKNLSLFAVVPTKPREENIQGYTIEVIVNSEIAKNHMKFSGAYHNHHNSLVLNFAAVQYLEGDKILGLRLIKILAEIDPGFVWSSPKLGNNSIQDILKGIEKNDGSMLNFLNEEKIQWEWRVKEYGRPNKCGCRGTSNP